MRPPLVVIQDFRPDEIILLGLMECNEIPEDAEVWPVEFIV